MSKRRFKFPLNTNILYFVKKECPFAAHLTQQEVKDIVLTKNQELLEELLDTGCCTLPGLGKLFITKVEANAINKDATFNKKQGTYKNPVRYVTDYQYKVIWQKLTPGQCLKYNKYYKFVLNRNVKPMIKDRVFNGSIVYFNKHDIYGSDRFYQHKRNSRTAVQ